MKKIRKSSEVILDQIGLEKKMIPVRGSVGYMSVKWNGTDRDFFLFNRQRGMRSRLVHSFSGHFIGTDIPEDGREEYALPPGTEPVSRDSRLGGVLLGNRFKVIDHKTSKGTIKVKLQELSTFNKPGGNTIDAIDGEYYWSSVESIHFNSLRETLRIYGLEIKETDIGKDVLEGDETEEEKARLLMLELSAIKKPDESMLEKQRRYIRKSNELRSQFLLDEIQDTIRRTRMLDGAIIIDGGPGTGKTTTMIQRITILTGDDIRDYRADLSDLDVEELMDSWVFISPSPLLKGFLKNNMIAEGLSADDKHLKVWDEHLRKLFRNYGLVDSAKLQPFILHHNSNQPIFNNDNTQIQAAKEIFSDIIVANLRKSFDKVISSNIDGMTWEQLGYEIQAIVSEAVKKESLFEWFEIKYRIRNRFIERVNEMLSDLTPDVDQLAVKVQVRLENTYQELHIELEKYLFSEFEKKATQEDDSLDEEDDILLPETKLPEFNAKFEINRFIKRLIHFWALQSLNRGFQIPPKQRIWVEKFKDVFQPFDFSKIAEMVYLRRFSQHVTSNINTILNIIPQLYKASRADIVSVLCESEDAALIEQIKKDNKRLYHDEMNFMMWFINNLLGSLQKEKVRIYNELNHKYKIAYEENKRCVIAVDEASDFSLIELAAISSLADIRYNSVTLSGDLMQAMEDKGIRNWQDVLQLLGTDDIFRLKKSYRQTATLVELAREFYQRVTGDAPDYISNLPKSNIEPLPEIVNTPDHLSTSTWLRDKILDIYSQYDGDIPSTAIFAHSDAEVDELKGLLRKDEKLSDVGILVKGCRSDGELISDNQVVIYNIESIKGLEFEAVFFPNIDLIENQSDDLIQRYLYVGISRSAYYLNISYRNKVPASIFETMESYLVS